MSAKTIKMSANNPMCMEMVKDVLVKVIEKEDNDERNKKRAKKA